MFANDSITHTDMCNHFVITLRLHFIGYLSITSQLMEVMTEIYSSTWEKLYVLDNEKHNALIDFED